jgi:hypothetical protein
LRGLDSFVIISSFSLSYFTSTPPGNPVHMIQIQSLLVIFHQSHAVASLDVSVFPFSFLLSIFTTVVGVVLGKVSQIMSLLCSNSAVVLFHSQ